MSKQVSKIPNKSIRQIIDEVLGLKINESFHIKSFNENLKKVNLENTIKNDTIIGKWYKPTNLIYSFCITTEHLNDKPSYIKSKLKNPVIILSEPINIEFYDKSGNLIVDEFIIVKTKPNKLNKAYYYFIQYNSELIIEDLEPIKINSPIVNYVNINKPIKVGNYGLLIDNSFNYNITDLFNPKFKSNKNTILERTLLAGYAPLYKKQTIEILSSPINLEIKIFKDSDKKYNGNFVLVKSIKYGTYHLVISHLLNIEQI